MGNVRRRWLPLALIAAVTGLTAYVTRALPSPVTIDLRGLLPFSLEPTADVARRAVMIVAMPALATAVWLLFATLRTRAALGLARRLYRDVPEALGDPATVDRIRPTYDTIVLWVVILILGIHAGMVAAALGRLTLAPRIISVVLGVSFMAIGNVFPRLRPNLIAGVRTRSTLSDPSLWRAIHRVFGVAFVMAGAATVLVGIVAPSFGVTTAVVCLIVTCVIAAVGGARAAVTSRA
jgi:threonine/homoserine/homoserine lactone efflux protein